MNINLKSASTMAFKDGTLKTTTSQSGVYVDTGCSVVLDNVTYDAAGYGLFPRGDAASVTVKNESIVTAKVMAIATNASSTDNYNVKILVDNSTITTSSDDGDNVAVMINVAGSLEIKNSVLTADRQVLIVRAGTASVSDSTLNFTNKYVSGLSGNDNRTTEWKTGNEVTSAAVVVGDDRTTDYSANAILNLKNVTLSSSDGKSLVVSQEQNGDVKYTSEVNIDNSSSILSSVYYYMYKNGSWGLVEANHPNGVTEATTKISTKTDGSFDPMYAT